MLNSTAIQSQSGTTLPAELEAMVPLGIRVTPDFIALVEPDGRAFRFWTVIPGVCIMLLFFNAFGALWAFSNGGSKVIGAIACALGSGFALIMGVYMWSQSPVRAAEVEVAAWRRTGEWLRLRGAEVSGRASALRVRIDVIGPLDRRGTFVFVCEFTNDAKSADGWEVLVWNMNPCRRVVRRLCKELGIGYGAG